MNYRVLLGLVLSVPGWTYAAQCGVLIMGDSLSSGYGLAAGESWVDKLQSRVQKTAPDWRVINASLSGDTLQNGLQRLGPALQRHRPTGVVIELGGNDALRGTPPAAIKQNLNKMVSMARATGAWVTLLAPPVLPNYGNTYVAAVARVYSDTAARHKLTLVPCFICDVGLNPALMQLDRIHPNALAQIRMLDSVWPHLKPNLRCPSGKRR